MHEHVQLHRDVRATVIPEGDKATLRKDTPVTITQTLGGSYTIQLDTGRKYRIEGEDADALGKEPTTLQSDAPEKELSPKEAEELGWELLKKVHDPEIPVNVVDLGLVYTLKIHTRGDGKYLAEVRMSLTAPGCGMGDVLLDDVRRQMLTIPGVETVDAQITFDPVWNPNMMTTAAKLKLGIL